MNTINFAHVISVLYVSGFIAAVVAQILSIPDFDLNAARRATLQKTVGPLTLPNRHTLIHFNAGRRNVSSIGPETADNLAWLDD